GPGLPSIPARLADSPRHALRLPTLPETAPSLVTEGAGRESPKVPGEALAASVVSVVVESTAWSEARSAIANVQITDRFHPKVPGRRREIPSGILLERVREERL